MGIKTVVFVCLLLFFFNIIVNKVAAVFDCLNLVVSSSQSDKDYCRNELTQIEAELVSLLNQQKEQQLRRTQARFFSRNRRVYFCEGSF